MKIIVTTSDNYLHLLPIFCHLFNTYWKDEEGYNPDVEIVGYQKPEFKLPNNFKFHSLGTQGGKKDFSNELKPYFEQLPDQYFIWLMEDTFIKSPVNNKALSFLFDKIKSIKKLGRMNLTGESMNYDRKVLDSNLDFVLYENAHNIRYRLSTQPSIWNKSFLLKYLTENLSPWDFETQDPRYDGYVICGLDKVQCPVKHNEGVRRFDIRKYNFEGIDPYVLEEMRSLQIVL